MICKIAILPVFLIGIAFAAAAQPLQEVKRDKGLLQQVYWQREDGTREGVYRVYYKDQLVEKGCYKAGKQVGKWQYYNFNNILEFEYDYDEKTITKIGLLSPPPGSWESTPCYFQGSPLEPYLFMVSNVFYPTRALEQNMSGRIVLTLKIDKKGRVYGYYLSEKLNHTLDKAVIEAAMKMPETWRFFPATRHGYPLVSEYAIAIEFEL